MTTLTSTEAKRCAAAAAAFRPDWNYASTFSYLQTSQANREYRDLAVALIACALDPKTDYPRRLEATDAGRFWRAALIAQDANLTPTPARFVPGVDDAKRQPEEVARKGAAACRDALGDAERADAARIEYELGSLRRRIKDLTPALTAMQRDDLVKAVYTLPVSHGRDGDKT